MKIAQIREKIVRIRERAKIQESWCIIKHLLNAEEHGTETIQKLSREMSEALESGDKKLASMKLIQIQELALLTDEIRRIRQEIVDMVFTFISEEKALESGRGNVSEEKAEAGAEGSGEDCGLQLFEEYTSEEEKED